MTSLNERLQKHITVGGVEYEINNSYRAAFVAWDAMQAVHDGRIERPLTAYHIAIGSILGVDSDIFEPEEIVEAAQEIMAYLQRYSTVGGNDKKDVAQVICLEQDAVMLRDAFRILGTDLYTEDISYAEFMSKLRLVATTEAPLCRLMYLRSLINDGKIGGKEHKSERAEINRLGRDLVYLKKWNSSNVKQQSHS